MLKHNAVFSSFSVNTIDQAQNFYGQTLGLDVTKTDQGLDIKLPGGGSLFIYPKGDQHTPATFTVLNFVVDNIDEAVDELLQQGIQFEHYDQEHMKTDTKGIVRSQGQGPTIAWFKDPAGNFLSLIENNK